MQLLVHVGRQQFVVLMQMPCVQRQLGVTVRNRVFVDDYLACERVSVQVVGPEQLLELSSSLLLGASLCFSSILIASPPKADITNHEPANAAGPITPVVIPNMREAYQILSVSPSGRNDGLDRFPRPLIWRSIDRRSHRKTQGKEGLRKDVFS